MKRVRAKRFREYDPHNDEYTEEVFQYLQERKAFRLFNLNIFHYWKTIDKEHVPSYAWIQAATTGFTDWKSKWNGIDGISWGAVGE